MRDDLISWSLIAPTPQCYYHVKSRSHIVYWQGIAMTRSHAMMIVQEAWLSSYASPTMKEEAYNQLKRAYLLGAFGHVPWGYTIQHMDANTHLSQLRKWIKRQNPVLLGNLTRDHSIKTAMGWFTKDYETMIDD